jgi:hypothetical protein
MATSRYSRVRYRRHFYRRHDFDGVKLLIGGVLAIAMASAGGVVTGHAVASAIKGGSSASGTYEQLGMTMAAKAGWTGAQAACLDLLWTRESGWRMVWNSAGSGAYGIPQALPASKMASAGADYMTNPATEIRWGLGYIAERYRTPCIAWRQETISGWY